MINLFWLEVSRSSENVTLPGRVLGLIQYIVGSDVRVCISDFQIKGKQRQHIDFRTGLDIHGVHILNL